MDSVKNDWKVIMNDLDSVFEGFFEWFAGQYDPLTGGFYYAKSSIKDEQFIPDIESSAQAINIMIRNELLQGIPEKMRHQMIRFFQTKQEPTTGYFFDENPAMREDEVMVHRAINYASNSLRRLGSNPKYPLPFKAQSAPSYVKTPESYLEKWESIDMSNSWRGCDRLATSCVYIGEMPEEEQGPFIDQAVDYLKSIQDPETGLWGEGSLYVRISGTFKLHTFYHTFNLPMPNTDRIYNSILTCLRTEVAEDMCYIRNPINLLSYIKPHIPDDDLKEILEITVKNIKKLKQQDGGFSREINQSPPAPNVAQVKEGEYYPNMPKPVNLGLGLVEGDMNASTQATLIRLQCHQLAGLPISPLIDSETFNAILLKKHELLRS